MSMIIINRIMRLAAKSAYAVLAAATVLVSCQQELVPAGELQPSGEETAPVTLTASFAQTKASYAEDGSNNLQPSWELGDVVHGYTSDGSHYTFTVKEVNGGVATLKGEATDGAFHLVFNCDGPCVSYDGQKGDKTMPAVMLADGVIAGMSGSFVFHNAGAVVGITNARGVPAGTEILKVTISGENLSSGTITLGSPGSLAADSKSSDEISTSTLSGITVGTGEDRAFSQPVYIAVAPGAKIAEVTLDAGNETYHYTLDTMAEAQVNDYLYVKGQTFEISPYVEIAGVKWARQNLAISQSGAMSWKGGNSTAVKVPGTDEDVINGDYFQWAAYAGYCGNSTDADKGLLVYTSFKSKKCVDGGSSDSFTFKSGKQFALDCAPHGGASYTKYTQSDGKKVLERAPENDDVASIILGGDWRMPTQAEYQALFEATFWAWDATDMGYYVFLPADAPGKSAGTRGTTTGLVKSKAKLFFPVQGGGFDNNLNNVGEEVFYWTSDLNTGTRTKALLLHLNNALVNPQETFFRYGGQTVRPVKDSNPSL